MNSKLDKNGFNKNGRQFKMISSTCQNASKENFK